MKRLVILLVLLLTGEFAFCQTWSDTALVITKLFDRYKPGNPGCQLSISRGGKVVYSHAWGMADVERGVPYTTETITEAGSISKQFTAAAILLLEQQGKLSLNDDICKYLPEFPNYGPVIRLGYLLHHTSGIREWSNLEAITGWPRTTRAYTNQDVFELLCRQKKLNNRPGTEYIYSNSNFVLLCLVVEKVSGMSLPDFTKRYIFEPAGMLHTSWRDNFKKIVPGRGIAYIKRGDHYEINMPNESVYGPGALLTTTEDLLKWAAYFLNNHLGSPGLLAKQLALDSIPSGAQATYAAGLVIGKYRGTDEISHTGQTASYVGIVESFPALQLSVAWLSNTTEFKDSLFVGINAINKLLIKNTSPDPGKKNVPMAVVPVSNPAQYAGWYRSVTTNKGTEINLKNNTLQLYNTALAPLTQTRFGYLESFLDFNNSGGFVLTTTDKKKTTFTKERAIAISPEYLRAFCGSYYSTETGSGFKLVFKDGKLMLEQNYLKDVVLSPTYSNAFNLYMDVDSDTHPVAANILFQKNSRGAITGCAVSTNDARGIAFAKVQ
jgi:CubicO group peptidase (beta-lactamase class C family)